ncbi:universal stress protein [Natronobeatus ordinarius]|uniref:universal stress protein n=1 Tax=Natronobeatus ordinarius TaxID=2963433 RepID=UPI0020CCF4E5|nr:universal stress protein [Natronobeatus ordinarius]
MTAHYLVPTDGSEQATKALEYVLETFPGSTVTVLSVVELQGPSGESIAPGWFDDEAQSEAERRAEETLEEARELAAEYDVDLQTAIGVGSPARSIVDQADERNVDHVVMGSHGRSGAARLLLGSVAETVVRRAPVTVTVVR